MVFKVVGLGLFCELFSFPRSLLCIQEVGMLLNLFVFLLLICLVLQGSLRQETEREKEKKIPLPFSGDGNNGG